MKYNIIAFSGSLRRESYNTRLVEAFGALAPAAVSFQLIDISGLPFINEDMEAQLPPAVTDLRESIKNADGVIFATPEYNRSYSPVLKNAIDWGSRPEGKNKWAQKPVAIVGCTPYTLGAFGAQNHLRQVFMYLDMIVVQQPEFYLSEAAGQFNAKGILAKKETETKVKEVWTALIRLIKIIKK